MERAETVEKVIIEIPAKPRFEINKKPSEQTRKLRVLTAEYPQTDLSKRIVSNFNARISKTTFQRTQIGNWSRFTLMTEFQGHT